MKAPQQPNILARLVPVIKVTGCGVRRGCLCAQVCVCAFSVAKSCPALCDPVDCSMPRSSVHGIFPGKNFGVGCHFLLQGIFPTQGSNPGLLCLLHWQADSLPLSHLRRPPAQGSHPQMTTHSIPGVPHASPWLAYSS